MADERLEIEITLDDGSIKKGFIDVEKRGQKTAKTLTGDFKTAARSVAKFAAGFAAAFIGVQAIRRAVNNLRDFQTALAEINTITDLTIDQQEALRRQLIGVSAQFGISAQEQAKAFYQVISAGVTDAAQATRLLESANKLAIGGLTTTAQAIDVLTSAVNSFGIENLSSERAADILFGTVRLGKTTVDELSSSLGRVLPTASALGVSFEDTNAALATLTTRGVATAEAVTGLNSVFSAVLRGQEAAAKQGQEVADAFNLQALRAKGLAGFLRDLTKATGGNEAALQKLLGSAEATRAVLTLAGDDFQSLQKNVDSLEDSLGASDRAFNEVATTIDQKINKLVTRTDAIFLELSNTTTGPLASALDFLNRQLLDIVNAFKAFNSFGDLLKATALNIAFIFIDLVSSIVRTLSQIPVIGKKIFGDFNTGILGTLESAKDDITNSIVGLIDVEQLEAQAKRAEDIINESVNNTKNQTKEVAKAGSDLAKTLNQTLNAGLAKSVSNGVQATIKGLQAGKNAFEAFGKGVLATMADVAIQLGETLILTGIGIESLKALSGAAAIAAGVGLVALGTILKSAFGDSSLSVGTGESSPGSPPLAGGVQEPVEQQEPSNQIAINIQGDVLDSDESGLRIANLLQKELDKSGNSILQVT